MLKRIWIPLLCCALMAGCAGRKAPLEAPDIRIVELIMNQPGKPESQSYDLILRIGNTSELELLVSDYEIELILDGQSAGMHSAQVNLAIPVLSNENVQLKGQLDQGQAQALVSLQNDQRGQMPYTLKGIVSAHGRSFKLSYDGWLSRSPGKSGSFR